MTTEELRARKKALGYTNKMISELSGVPVGTVNKIFSGETDSPRFDTLRAIEKVLTDRKYKKEHSKYVYNLPDEDSSTLRIEENVLATFYSVRKRPGEYTIEDLEALPEGRRAELIEGCFYDMAEPTRVHQTVVLQVAFQLQKCVDKHPGTCQLYIAPTGVKLAGDNKTVVEPDVLVVCDEKKLRDPGYIIGPPDLCVEVLSLSNKDHDMVFKLKIYRDYGVREYWVIDPEKESILVYDLTDFNFPDHYSFDDSVPVDISSGECLVDFREIKDRLHRQKSLYGK